MSATTPLLLLVPKDRPSREEKISAFKTEHGIETNYCKGLDKKDHPWLACHMPSALKFGYGVTADSTMFDCVAKIGRLLEESGMMTTGETERAAIQELCSNLKISFSL